MHFKKFILSGCALLLIEFISAAGEPELKLWYKQPATNWVTQALPIGNGTMGAMVMGGTDVDRLQFNEKTLWRGSEQPGDLGTYLSFGDLYITNVDSCRTFTTYARALDLGQAIATVDYTTAGGNFSREYFASNPAEVIVVNYSASSGASISVDITLNSAQGATTHYEGNKAQFEGMLSNGMQYAAEAQVISVGGEIETTPAGLKVRGAKAMTVYLSCSTDFDPLQPAHLSGINPAPTVAAKIAAALTDGYAKVKANHIADHSSLFSRVKFSINDAANDLPTDSLLQSAEERHRNMVDMLIFQYGRYLTIASSRGVDLPSNLQGIWNKDGSPTASAVWASDIHTNINVQMNYWPVEAANLSECHMPLLNFLRNEARRPDGGWQRNARNLGASQGWVINTASNIFGGSSNYKAGKYSVAAAWLCDHLWQHYAYTLDREYLIGHAWPLMRSTAGFWLERLVEAPDGSLECPREYSPEQGRVQNATAHSQQLVGMLLRNSLAAIDSIGATDELPLRDSIASALKRLDSGLRVDSCDQLREWKYQSNAPNLPADTLFFANDEENVWQCHRHTSHLVGLYPGFLISPDGDPDIFEAAINSLTDRGHTSTGWARAWRIALWARALNSVEAYAALRGFAHPTSAQTYDWHGGLYDNMLDAHATSVFQIEGNFGATAGIIEMLLLSTPDGKLKPLPALPRQWRSGSISGLKARGNREVSLTWTDGQLTSLTVD